MNWYSTNTEKFPPAVQRILLSDETSIHQRYTIRSAIRVCGTELWYLAEDTETSEYIILHELLPMRWCMRDENGCWTPYQSDAQEQFALIRQRCFNRYEQLQKQQEEFAVESILDLFEEQGTIWFVTNFVAQEPLAQTMGERIFSPQEAIDLIAPVMDTLAGFHGQSMYHGSISAHSIMLHEKDIILTSWCTAICTEDGTPDAATDVQAISRLLYRMMTGEQVYHKETAAILPKGIRNALQKGMDGSDLTMEQLWLQLHTDHPDKRQKQTVLSHGSYSGFTVRFTVLFCTLCLLFAALCVGWIVIGGQLKDTSYQISKEQIRVPELLYMTQEEAIETASDLGLHVIVAARQNNPVVEKELVITQKPSAGAILAQGEAIQLTLSDGWENYVPNVCNLLLEDAEKKLADLGFLVEYKEIESPGNAPGTVISQNVKADTLLELDSCIELKVSLGRMDVDASKREVVDHYVGMQFDEAKAMLSEKCLYALQAEAVYDKEVPKGCVIAQNIPEGRRVPQGTVIEMKVSLGVETVRVPHVERMSAENARGMLERLRLKPVLIYAASSKFAADSVIEQSVASGKTIPVGTEIWLTISTGKGSSVISTGGWSGDPLPTIKETEETTESDSETQTDVTEESTETTMQDSTERTDNETTVTTTTTNKRKTSTTETTTSTSSKKTTTKSTTTTTKTTKTTTTTKSTTTTKAATTTKNTTTKSQTTTTVNEEPKQTTTKAKETSVETASAEN